MLRTALKRHHPVPLYQQLAATLRAQIESRQYGAQERLPSERELATRFHVSRMTVRQALEALARDGLVAGRVGKGTFMIEPKINQQLANLTGFSQDVSQRHQQPSSRVVKAEGMLAGKDVSVALELEPKARVYNLIRVRYANGSPLAVENAFLPEHLCPNLLKHDFARESLYETLQSEYGWNLIRARQTMEARFATSQETKWLDLGRPAPILALERITMVMQGFPIEYVRSAYRGDRYKFIALLTPS